MSGYTICLIDAVGNPLLVAVPKLPYSHRVAVYASRGLVSPPSPSVHYIDFVATDERDPLGRVVYRQAGYPRAPIRWRL